MTETIVHLKPSDQWPPGMTLDQLRATWVGRLQLPGVSNIWTMPIINRIDMLTTGIRSEVGVKIFGTDLTVLEDRARDRRCRPTVPGASNVYPEQVTSGQYLNIEVDRAAAARYGIDVGDMQQVIETAIGETKLTTTIEGRQAFPGPGAICAAVPRGSGGARQVLVAASNGAQIPLGQVVDYRAARGPAMITAKTACCIATVLLNVQGRDVGRSSSMRTASRSPHGRVAARVLLGWSGRWENQERARQRLQIVMPIVLGVIFVLLYLDLSLVARSRARSAGRALRADRRRVSPVAAAATTSRSRCG